MTLPNTRTYSRYTKSAAELLGKQIKLGRKARQLTMQDLADRAGISKGTLQKIEKGDLRCEIGIVFEVATLVGIKLFDSDQDTLNLRIELADSKIALLPKSVHIKQKDVDDDF
ncbi:helix-turn-helix transcriptional regulator [Endozoicomonas sp. SM1973]|uniref:Helix-turn-helix transcriptional regulator n=2 Tax=Spartinivicinus marinus TaxID=2994442 RepID=A0A853IBH0_9GAMM|nr:helix-turn-helix transcriptional regulator [Spartinivicinus marinus]NYZ69182.1 helix-turn-helix transcriptional regulator [Spartinivicinus marinus]